LHQLVDAYFTHIDKPICVPNECHKGPVFLIIGHIHHRCMGGVGKNGGVQHHGHHQVELFVYVQQLGG
jgi:hypothetical protein